MTGPILPISVPALADTMGPSAPSRADGAFEHALAAAIRTVEASGQNAAAATQQFLNGEGGELHTTILAVQRAELAFDMFLQARNKVVSAYQEIMRMQM
ncbi:MAG TPA: flagellar hook-basal body complex protein FliE [Bryobacteraceae bacterium]|nr:flagellar hook-basal body complex protein FliE [Bryobacteraceae bacterium]